MQSSTDAEIINTDTSTEVILLGAHLKMLREKAGMSVDDVWLQCKIPQNKIPMLESEDYESIGTPVFVAGYLRRYAKVLGVDADVLVAQYSQLHGSRTDNDNAMFENKAVAFDSGSKRRAFVVVCFAIIVLALIGFTISLLGKDTAESSVTVLGDAALEMLVADSNIPADASADSVDLDEFRGVDPDRVTIVDVSGVDGDIVEEGVVSEVLAAGPELNTAGSVLNAVVPELETAVSTNQELDLDAPVQIVVTESDVAQSTLEMQFSDDCWVEVKDANATSIFAQLKTSGDNLRLLGQAPFNVMLGNARAVSATIDGHAVLIPIHESKKTARFDVELPN